MMRQNHGPWTYPPRRRERSSRAAARALFLAGLVVAGLVVAHTATKAIANAAHFNAGHYCGAC